MATALEEFVDRAADGVAALADRLEADTAAANGSAAALAPLAAEMALAEAARAQQIWRWVGADLWREPFGEKADSELTRSMALFKACRRAIASAQTLWRYVGGHSEKAAELQAAADTVRVLIRAADNAIWHRANPITPETQVKIDEAIRRSQAGESKSFSREELLARFRKARGES